MVLLGDVELFHERDEGCQRLTCSVADDKAVHKDCEILDHIYLSFFGQIFNISVSHLELIYAQVSKRRWFVSWAIWMCLEGVYVFRHRNRCDCPPNPPVQLVSERIAIANRLSSV